MPGPRGRETAALCIKPAVARGLPLSPGMPCLRRRSIRTNHWQPLGTALECEEGGDGWPHRSVEAVEKSSTKTAPNRVVVTFIRVHALVIAEWKARRALLNHRTRTRFTESFILGPAV